jgi:hypothetical protein
LAVSRRSAQLGTEVTGDKRKASFVLMLPMMERLKIEIENRLLIPKKVELLRN